MDKARLLVASSPHTGDWIHAPPIASVGLWLSDEAVARITYTVLEETLNPAQSINLCE